MNVEFSVSNVLKANRRCKLHFVANHSANGLWTAFKKLDNGSIEIRILEFISIIGL